MSRREKEENVAGEILEDLKTEKILERIKTSFHRLMKTDEFSTE